MKFLKELFPLKLLGDIYKGSQLQEGLLAFVFLLLHVYFLLYVHLGISHIDSSSDGSHAGTAAWPWHCVNILMCFYKHILFSPVWSKSHTGFPVSLLVCEISSFNKDQKLKKKKGQQIRHFTNLTFPSCYNFLYLFNFHKWSPVLLKENICYIIHWGPKAFYIYYHLCVGEKVCLTLRANDFSIIKEMNCGR